MPVKVEVPDLGLVGTTSRSASWRAMPLYAHELPNRKQLSSWPHGLLSRFRFRRNREYEMASTILLGGPDAAQLQPRPDEDPHLADRRQGAEFWSVLMTLSVDPAPEERIRSAWLSVDLRAVSGESPTAFHLDPGRREEGTSIEQTGQAEAALKPIKVSGGIKRSWVHYQVEILSRNRLRSDPRWEIAPSPSRFIDGDQDFVLVVKVPNGTIEPSGRVAFGGVGSYAGREAELAGKPVDFRLA